MSLTTQLGLPVSGRRAACASVLAATTLAGLLGGKKRVFDSVMISAFVLGLATCIPLGIDVPRQAGSSQ